MRIGVDGFDFVNEKCFIKWIHQEVVQYFLSACNALSVLNRSIEEFICEKTKNQFVMLSCSVFMSASLNEKPF